MNKKIIISIFIATLFVTTLFAPSVLSDRRIRTEDVLLDKAESVPATKLTPKSIVPNQISPKQIQSQDVFRAERTPRVSIPRPVLITPNNPTPSNGATNVELLLCLYQTNVYGNLVLEWDADDTYYDIQYHLYLGETNPPQYRGKFCASEGNGHFSQELSSWLYPNGCFLEYNTEYFWQIKTMSPGYTTPDGPVWNFTTEQDPSLDESIIVPHTPNPADGETGVELLYTSSLDVYESLGFEWYSGTPDPAKMLRYFIAVDTVNPPQTEPKVFCSSNHDEYGPFSRAYWLGEDAQCNTEYFWQITVKEMWINGDGLTGTVVEGPVWSFTTEKSPQIVSAWSCASHGRVSDIKLPVDFENPFGVIDPRDQSHNVNTDENDRYIEVVFNSPVSCRDIGVSILPELSGEVYIVQNSAPNTINIQFASRIPDGVYTISITSTSHSPSSFVLPPHTINECFSISYLNGDVTGDGVVDLDDITEIINENNWQRSLSDIDTSQISLPLNLVNPACDINRDGIVSGLDIARIFNSANFGQAIV